MTTAAAPIPTRPPPAACDCHAHVFGPLERFPPSAQSPYPPPTAPVEAYLGMLDSLGLDRGVLVQAAPYGEDNAALLDALASAERRLRGVALASPSIADADLGRLAAHGVKGLRFSHFPGSSGRNVAVIGPEALQHLAPRMRAHGLHAQLWMPCDAFVALAPELLRAKVPLVLDHMVRIDPARGLDAPECQRLLQLLRDEDLWMKLIPHRASTQYPDYPDLPIFHAAFVEARPDRMLWGTDWPFVRMGDATPDAAHLLSLFSAWTPDADLRKRILVDNPAALYGFEASHVV